MESINVPVSLSVVNMCRTTVIDCLLPIISPSGGEGISVISGREENPYASPKRSSEPTSLSPMSELALALTRRKRFCVTHALRSIILIMIDGWDDQTCPIAHRFQFFFCLRSPGVAFQQGGKIKSCTRCHCTTGDINVQPARKFTLIGSNAQLHTQTHTYRRDRPG